jgi:hypothetical protein
MEKITVRSFPVGDREDGQFFLDCSDCGDLGLANTAIDARVWAMEHLEAHGINTDPLSNS